MTAQEPYDIALILIDEVDEDGEFTDDAAREKRAPYLIDALQREIAKAEGIETSDITSFTDVLVISDDSAKRILPYGLAAEFALSDGLKEFAARYQNTYDQRFKQIGVTIEDFNDDQNVMKGF